MTFGEEPIRSWLICIQHLSCSVSLRGMLGGSHVEVRSQNSLYQFIEGQYNFGIPRGVRMSLALNELKHITLH